MNKKVDEYIEKQQSPQKDICMKLRNIILHTLPGIEEEMKWGVPTYAQGICYFVALRDHVNLGFSLKGLSEEKQELLEGSGKTMRHIKIRSLKEINENKIVALLKSVWKQEANMI